MEKPSFFFSENPNDPMVDRIDEEFLKINLPEVSFETELGASNQELARKQIEIERLRRAQLAASQAGAAATEAVVQTRQQENVADRVQAAPYKKPSERRREQEQNKDSEKSRKAAANEAAKIEADRDIRELLGELREKGNTGSKPVELLRPARGHEKFGDRSSDLPLMNRLRPEEFIWHDELKTSAKTRLRYNSKKPDRMFGHVATGDTVGWAISRTPPSITDFPDNAPNLPIMGTGGSRINRRRERRNEGPYTLSLPSPAPTTMNSRILTYENGEIIIYERFDTLKDREGKGVGYAVVDIEGKKLSDMSVKDLSIEDRRIIAQNLNNILEDDSQS